MCYYDRHLTGTALDHRLGTGPAVTNNPPMVRSISTTVKTMDADIIVLLSSSSEKDGRINEITSSLGLAFE